MSSISQASASAAVSFNERQAVRSGWGGQIPAEAIAYWPALALDPVDGSGADKLAFARAVAEFQGWHGNGLDDDGKLGRQTWMALVAVFNSVDDGATYLVDRGRRFELVGGDVPIAAFDAGGLDLHPGGDFYSWHKRNNAHKRIVLHWGGHDRQGCRNVLLNRDLSSHYGVDADGCDQWLDLGHTGWHAGWANIDAIGIDVCQQPVVEFTAKYAARGYQVEKIENPARKPGGGYKGNKFVLTLDKRTAKNLLGLLRLLCAHYDIPYRVPRGSDGLAETGPLWHGAFNQTTAMSYSGILCHGHVSTGKWDVNPWMAQLFGENAI